MKEASNLRMQIIDWCASHSIIVYPTNVVKKLAGGRWASGKKGLPDICGYQCKTGRAVFIEIKIGKDTIKPEQEAFLREAFENNCIAVIAKTFEQFKTDLNKYLYE